MNFSEVIKTLNQASAFDLYRLRAAIDRVLDEPRWMQSVQVRIAYSVDRDQACLDNMQLEFRTVEPALGDLGGASFARHGVHDVMYPKFWTLSLKNGFTVLSIRNPEAAH